MGSGQTPGELLTPLVLNSILSKALQYSLHGDSPLAGNFTFALRFLPETFHPHAPDSLNCLELRYKVRQCVVWEAVTRVCTLERLCLSQHEWQLESDNLSCFDKQLWVWKSGCPTLKWLNLVDWLELEFFWMTCTVTNVAHVVLCSHSHLCLSPSIALITHASPYWISILCCSWVLPSLPPTFISCFMYFATCILSLSLSKHLFHIPLCFSPHVSPLCLPLTILSPPLSMSLPSHLPSPHLSLSLRPFFPTPVPLSCAFFHTQLHSHPHSLFFSPCFGVSLLPRVISQVDWPLNIIITDSCMNKYNRLFSFLLQLKHMVWSLRDVWFHLKRTGDESSWSRLSLDSTLSPRRKT